MSEPIKPADADDLIDRVSLALGRITLGYPSMRLPADRSDADIVLIDCLARIQSDAAKLKERDKQIARLKDDYTLERRSNIRECARVDSYALRIEELESLIACYADDEAAVRHTVVDSQQAIVDEGNAILARRGLSWLRDVATKLTGLNTTRP